jgi:Tol biopolymer transport system component
MKTIMTVIRWAAAALVLCVLSFMGSGRVALGATPGHNPASNNAPTGKSERIVFTSSRALDGGNATSANYVFNIWVMNAKGSKATPLTRSVASAIYSYDASWSPDGTMIAFYSNRALDGSDAAISDSIQNVWVVKADGTGATPLTKLKAGQTKEPHWLP